MTKIDKSGKPKPDVDAATAKGEGEGGCSPHPKTQSDEPAPFDPHAYRPNVEPPDLKPVGKSNPNTAEPPRPAHQAKEPAANDTPVPEQRSTDPRGTGHERSKGGLPEKQPSETEQ